MKKITPTNLLSFPRMVRPAYQLKLTAKYSESEIDFREDESANVQIYAADHHVGRIELKNGELIYHPMDSNRQSCYVLHEKFPCTHLFTAHSGVGLTLINTNGVVKVSMIFPLSVDPPELLFYTTKSLARLKVGSVQNAVRDNIFGPGEKSE